MVVELPVPVVVQHTAVVYYTVVAAMMRLSVYLQPVLRIKSTFLRSGAALDRIRCILYSAVQLSVLLYLQAHRSRYKILLLDRVVFRISCNCSSLTL